MKMVQCLQVKERTYDLKSREQGRMIQVSIPATAGTRWKKQMSRE